jgi:hypothetical protein
MEHVLEQTQVVQAKGEPPARGLRHAYCSLLSSTSVSVTHRRSTIVVLHVIPLTSDSLCCICYLNFRSQVWLLAPSSTQVSACQGSGAAPCVM